MKLSNIPILLTDVGSDVINQISHGTPSTTYLANLDTNGTKVFQDTYTLIMVIGLFGAVLMFICGLIAYMIPTNGSQEKAQAKKKIEWILVGVFLLCMAVVIVGWIHHAGQGTFGG